MGGGLMQLVAYGAQDIYLTGNPQITFWKVVYRRHTNFARETVEQTISGTSTLTTSSTRGTVTVSRNGDLLSNVYVTSETAAVTSGDRIVNDVEVQIGGQKIDKHTYEWMQVWNELSCSDSKADGFKAMTGCVGSSGTTGAGMVQVPLLFWFCRNPGLALPLIALQYHEVKLVFNWGTSTVVGAAAVVKVLCDYVYLDTDERRRFAQVSHEYLIEQLQYQTEGSSKASVKLTLNHPVKSLYWTEAGTITTETAKLKLNGHDRFAAQKKEYFQLRQPMDHHSAVPRQNLPTALVGSGGLQIISGNTGNGTLTADIDKGFGATDAFADAAGFNLVTAAGDGTAVSAANAIAAAGTIRSHLLAIGGTNALSSFARGSVRVGDYHLLTFSDEVATGTSLSTTTTIIAKVSSLWADSAGNGSTIGAGFGPIAAGETVGDLSDASAEASTVYILYDQALQQADGAATLTIAAADGDKLVVAKLGGRSEARTSHMTRNVNMYSFALEPEEHQPSGTCNFSRIDTATLELSTAAVLQNVYALNYNVLRIMSGMGGLAYSN
jgi:hypothetical protein